MIVFRCSQKSISFPANIAFENARTVLKGYRDILYTNILYTWQSLYELSLYRTDFIGDKVYTGQILYGDKIYTRTKFIRGQSLYGTKFIRWQSLYEDKVYTNFFNTVLKLKDIKWMLKTCISYNQIIYEYVTVTVTAC